MSELPTVVVGGGFVGLFAAMHLCHQKHSRHIILIDQNERFVFKPLLYEILSGELNEHQVCPRYDYLLNCDEVAYIHDIVEHIDLDGRQVQLASGLRYHYGYLVLGLGSTVHDFGIEGVKDYAFPFRTGEDVVALRQHLRHCLQQASQTRDPNRRQALLTVAIVGGGPAGIEMAATLGDLLPQWADQFQGLRSQLRIIVVNRGKDILKGDINDGLRETARQALQQRLVPVEILTGASATQVKSHCLVYQQDEQLQELGTHSVIWTAGNRVNPIIQNLALPAESKDQGGRLRVLPTLQLPNYPDVFAAGDCTIISDYPQPATAQVAYQQGGAIAANLNAIVKNQSPKPAEVNLRGTLMKLGQAEGAANLFNRKIIAGRTGHLIRQGTYLELLPNPVHNFQATLGWLTDEMLQRHVGKKRMLKSGSKQLVPQWATNLAIGLAAVVSGLLIWRFVAPKHFEKTWERTEIPALNQEPPSQN